MNLSPPISHHHHRHRHRSSRSPQRYYNENDQERINYIIDTFLRNFADKIRENSKAWRNRFRKMAENPFAFYRGSAILFYRDMQYDSHQDPWLKNCQEASRIFIHVRIKISLKQNS